MSEETDYKDLKSPAKDDTNPFGHIAYKPKLKFQRWAIGFALVTIIILLLALIFHQFISKQKSKILPAIATKRMVKAPPAPAIKDRLSAQLQVNEIVARETDARHHEKRLWELISQLPEKSSIDTKGWDFNNLTPGQMSVLWQKARNGDAAAIEFLVQLGQYIVLKNRISGLESRLGTPGSVAAGDTHFQIAYDFLTGRAGRTKEEARQILQGTRLQQPLLVGFKVWNFWLADGFCTFVTQGSALLTPEETTQQDLEKQLQKNKIEKEIELTRLNSLFYILGAYGELKDQNILTGSFFKSTRMGEIAPERFLLSIDLRNQQYIQLNALALHMKRISKVDVFPHEFKADRDYTIWLGPQGRWAQFTVLKKEIFRGRRIVIAVE